MGRGDTSADHRNRCMSPAPMPGSTSPARGHLRPSSATPPPSDAWGPGCLPRSQRNLRRRRPLHRDGQTEQSMPTPQELETKFWQALKSDMTMMVGLDGVEDGHARPMTAQVDGERGPIWFFTAKDTEIVRRVKEGNRAIATFSSKGHDLFATVHGSLQLDNDRGISTGC